MELGWKVEEGRTFQEFSWGQTIENRIGGGSVSRNQVISYISIEAIGCSDPPPPVLDIKFLLMTTPSVLPALNMASTGRFGLLQSTLHHKL